MTSELIIFDWAGTLIDFGCRAPLVAFLEAFDRAGLPIDEATARGPMGANKRDHIVEILKVPEVARRAQEAFGDRAGEALVDELYEGFKLRLMEVLPEHAAPIPGVPETLAELRERGIALGSTTGYTREMMERVLPLAVASGVELDLLVCSDEVPAGRPAPWACFRIAERLGCYPLRNAVKVGDTPIDMAEGVNAGMRTVGVSATGNEVGLSLESWSALGAAERKQREGLARERLLAAGAEAVLASLRELPDWLRDAAR